MEYRVRKRNIEEASGGAAQQLDAVLTDALLRRFHLRAGFTTTSARSLEQTRNFLSDFLEKLLDAVVVIMGHHNRRTVLLTDVLRACRHYGIRLYGYDDMCVIEGPWGITEYHVTEMVELNTTFNRSADSDEPDHEPSAYYKRTDFVQNQRAWDADDEEDEDSGDDSEWSWYSESDADSDCEDDDDLEATASARPASRWRRGDDPKDVFLQSLQVAQAVVDDQLLIKEPDSESMEYDAPMGQGYESDCDSSRVTASHRDWQGSLEGEESKWEVKGAVTEYEESDTESYSDCEAMEDDDHGFHEGLPEYVISRQAFVDIFYAALYGASNCSLPISSVALSALHNVSEQYLHGALTSGNLRTQIVATLMEEHLKATLAERADIEAERRKVKDVEAAMVEMQSAFQLKEREMQRQIAELERQLQQQRGDPLVDVEMEPKPKISPGKRKASSKDVPLIAKGKTPASSSIVGSLRSRLHEYSLRKKAKISPI